MLAPIVRAPRTPKYNDALRRGIRDWATRSSEPDRTAPTPGQTGGPGGGGGGAASGPAGSAGCGSGSAGTSGSTGASGSTGNDACVGSGSLGSRACGGSFGPLSVTWPHRAALRPCR